MSEERNQILKMIASGETDQQIRLSLGYEPDLTDIDDLTMTLEQALKAVDIMDE